MENTQEQKTPEQWFMQLKEPYRSKAIKAIVFNHDKRFDSLLKALMNSTNWILAGFEEIITSLNKGETTYLEPETLKPEPIELRPEDLVSGEVYKNVVKYNDGDICYYIYKFISLNGDDAGYSKMINYKGDIFYNDTVCLKSNVENVVEKKIYHATPEEKALLLGEEELTDWKAKYNELKAKFDQLEPKGEKVYFYFDYLDNLIKTTDFEFALHESSEDSPIYKGVFIGKKKSVLVNE